MFSSRYGKDLILALAVFYFYLFFFFFYLVDVLISVAVMSICPSVCPLADDVIHHKFIRQFFQLFLQDRSEN